MAPTDDFKEYEGKKVTVLLDARTLADGANFSFAFDGVLGKETADTIHLSVVSPYGINSWHRTPVAEKGYKSAIINKAYVVGVFESTEVPEGTKTAKESSE